MKVKSSLLIIFVANKKVASIDRWWIPMKQRNRDTRFCRQTFKTGELWLQMRFSWKERENRSPEKVIGCFRFVSTCTCR